MNEQLIMLLVFGAIAAISTWVNKKRQERAEREQQQPPFTSADQADAPPPRRATSWEEELRRLLEGESPAAPPPRPSPPVNRPMVPPVILRAPTPSPVYVPPVPVVAQPSAEELLQQAYARKETARQALRQAEDQARSTLQRTSAQANLGPVAGIAIRTALHNREALRSAFVMSLVFSAPKSLEDQ